jgi:tetratricopeptide (TPR) repeat protein
MSNDSILDEAAQEIKSGNFGEAQEKLSALLVTDPHNKRAWQLMAKTTHQYAQKKEFLLKALALDPADQEIQNQLAYIEKRIIEGREHKPDVVTTLPEPDTRSDQEYEQQMLDYETGLRKTRPAPRGAPPESRTGDAARAMPADDQETSQAERPAAPLSLRKRIQLFFKQMLKTWTR